MTWSVAEGRRGRRWRSVSNDAHGIIHVLLLEVDRAGRPSRLELTTSAGLLTLHPSADQREIHGNVVSATGEGVRPLAFDWGQERELEVIGRPLATVAALHRRRAHVKVGRGGTLDVLSIDPELHVATASRSFERLTERRWRVGTLELEIDEDGLPLGGRRWPLEPE